MAGPYLKSGESIILTTDRVTIDGVEYDIILTSQRVALVDSSHSSDKPLVIPFATILSVKGGSTPAREPFITITVVDPAIPEESKNLEMIFSQQPYEDRAPECDIWVKKLIEYIVSGKQEPIFAGTSRPVEGSSTGLRPTVRRWSAPEVPQPHLEARQEIQRPSADLLSAIQKTSLDPVEKIDEGSLRRVQSRQGENPPSGDDEGQGSASTVPVLQEESGSPPASSDPHDQNVMPSDNGQNGIIEEADGEGQVPSELTIRSSPVPTGSIEDPVNSPEEIKDSGSAATGGLKYPDIMENGDPKQSSGTVSVYERHMAAVEEKTPGDGFDTIEEISGDTPHEKHRSSSFGEGGDALETGFGEDSGSPVRVGLPESVVFPVLGVKAVSPPPETPVLESPAIKLPESPASPAGKRSGQLVVFILAVLIIIGGAAGVLFFINANIDDATPSVTITSAPTVIPTMPVVTSVIASTGVWIKVSYNGTFIGKYGNPGDLKDVRASGEQVYPITDGNDLVQATFQKLDNSGNILTVEVYTNGSLVANMSKRTPKGSIAILVDPKTGKVPYIPVTTTGI